MERYQHVILLCIDNLRASALPPLLAGASKGANGRRARPALDFGADCAVFDNCIAAAPYTSAALAAVLTGRWPKRAGPCGMLGGKVVAPTLLGYFRKAGYRTLLKTDFPVTFGRALGFDRGADRYVVEDDAAVLRFLQRSRDVRTFSVVHFGDLELPYAFSRSKRVDAKRKKRLLERRLGLRPDGGDDAAPGDDWLPEWATSAAELEKIRRYRGLLGHLHRRQDFETLEGFYRAGVEAFAAGRFAVFLRALALLLADRRKLIVICSDHGEVFDHDSCGHAGSLEDLALRVPLLFQGPGIARAAHATRVRSIDLAATLADLCGLPSSISASTDGASLAEAVREGTRLPDRIAVAQSYQAGAGTADAPRAGAKRPARAAAVALSSEVIYSGAFRLSRRYLATARTSASAGERTATSGTLQVPTPEGPWTQTVNAAESDRLRADLDSHNWSLRRSDSRAIPIHLQQQLLDMRYHL